jgi:cytochrome c
MVDPDANALQQRSLRLSNIFRLLVLTVISIAAGTSVAPAQAIEKGQQVFAACAACHAPDKNGIGPKLAGVIGRTSGSVEGFHYSRAMRNAKIIWDANTLDAYLAEPQKVVPGNLMPFSGIADSHERSEVIAYLESLKE